MDSYLPSLKTRENITMDNDVIWLRREASGSGGATIFFFQTRNSRQTRRCFLDGRTADRIRDKLWWDSDGLKMMPLSIERGGWPTDNITITPHNRLILAGGWKVERGANKTTGKLKSVVLIWNAWSWRSVYPSFTHSFISSFHSFGSFIHLYHGEIFSSDRKSVV